MSFDFFCEPFCHKITYDFVQISESFMLFVGYDVEHMTCRENIMLQSCIIQHNLLTIPVCVFLCSHLNLETFSRILT